MLDFHKIFIFIFIFASTPDFSEEARSDACAIENVELAQNSISGIYGRDRNV